MTSTAREFSSESRFLILLAVVIIPLLTDELNGFIREETNFSFSISQAYKSLLIFFSIVYILRHRSKYTAPLLFFFFSIILSLITILITKDVTILSTAFYKDIRFVIKLIYFPVLFAGLKEWFKHNPISNKKFQKINTIAFFIIVTAVFISVLGIGINTYQTSGAGYKGYFLSQNELSTLCILLFSNIIFQQFYEWKFITSVSTILLTFLTCFLIGTKTLMAGFFLILFFQFLLNEFYFNKLKSQFASIKKRRLYHFTGILSLTVVFFIIIFPLILPVFQRIYNKFIWHDSMITFLTSSRSTRIEPAFTHTISEGSLFNYIFGHGYHSYTTTNEKWFNYGLVEIDFIDIWGIGGIWNVVIFYGFWFFLLLWLLLLYLHRITVYSIPVITGYTIILINSFIAGHVIHSGIATGYISFTLAFILSRRKKHIEVS